MLQSTHFDAIVIGGGPAGLTAGIYLSRARLRTLIISDGVPGGQMILTHEIANYPGVESISGYQLSNIMKKQAKNFGCEIKSNTAVVGLSLDNDIKEVTLSDGQIYASDAIILTPGGRSRTLQVEGESQFKGRGISYCATCDAKYFVDKEAIVIGGGNSAVEESDFIAKFASKVTIVHQFDTFTANKTAQEKVLANPKINVKFEHEPRAFRREGDKIVVVVEDLKTKESKELVSDGAFIFIGMKPNTALFHDRLNLDKWGYIKTDEDMRTSLPDVYAVGDIISKKYRQITTAVADGTIAAISIARELN